MDQDEPYAVISYVQLPNENEHDTQPFISIFWAQSVCNTLKILVHNKLLNRPLVWFDKMAVLQFKGSNVIWPMTANLQYSLRPVITVIPTQMENRYLSRPGWHPRNNTIDKIAGEMYNHMCVCKNCKIYPFSEGSYAPIAIGCLGKCWPSVERAAASSKGMMFTNPNIFMHILSSMIVLLNLAFQSIVGQNDLFVRTVLHNILTSCGFEYTERKAQLITTDLNNQIPYHNGILFIAEKLKIKWNVDFLEKIKFEACFNAPKIQKYEEAEKIQDSIILLDEIVTNVKRSEYLVATGQFVQEDFKISRRAQIGALVCGDAGGAPAFCDIDKFSAILTFENPEITLEVASKSIKNNLMGEINTSADRFVYYAKEVNKAMLQDKGNRNFKTGFQFKLTPLAGCETSRKENPISVTDETGKIWQYDFVGHLTGNLPWKNVVEKAVKDNKVEVLEALSELRYRAQEDFLFGLKYIAVSYVVDRDKLTNHVPILTREDCWWCRTSQNQNFGEMTQEHLLDIVTENIGNVWLCSQYPTLENSSRIIEGFDDQKSEIDTIFASITKLDSGIAEVGTIMWIPYMEHKKKGSCLKCGTKNLNMYFPHEKECSNNRTRLDVYELSHHEIENLKNEITKFY